MSAYHSYKFSFNTLYGYRPCNHKYPETAKFCPECGKSLIPTNEAIWKSVAAAIDESRKDPSLQYQLTGVERTIETVLAGETVTGWDTVNDWKIITTYMRDVVVTIDIQYEEDTFDQWREYYLNGKVQVAKARVSIEEFDQSKLE